MQLKIILIRKLHDFGNIVAHVKYTVLQTQWATWCM